MTLPPPAIAENTPSRRELPKRKIRPIMIKIIIVSMSLFFTNIGKSIHLKKFLVTFF